MPCRHAKNVAGCPIPGAPGVGDRFDHADVSLFWSIPHIYEKLEHSEEGGRFPLAVEELVLVT